MTVVGIAFAEKINTDLFVKKYLGGIELMRSSVIDSYRIYTGDSNGDSTKDIAIVYNEMIPGANNYVQSLSFFESSRDSVTGYDYIFDKAIGNRGSTSIDNIKMSRNVITLETLEFGPNDPMCCPSLKKQVQCKLSNNKLSCSPDIFGK